MHRRMTICSIRWPLLIPCRSIAAVLESNPEEAEASGLKAGILLVNQNGKWLIDLLVLVQDS